MSWGMIGAALGALGVMLGAFGAHALEDRLSEEQSAWFQTGVQYHFVHALALLAVAALVKAGHESAGRAGPWFTIGVLVFSGTLYAMALGGPKWLGAVTPLGGTAFIVGWALLAWSLRSA